MADILIRGISMPKGCKSCKLSSDSHCNATGQWLFSTDLIRSGFNWKTCRLENCPLHELPEHGDLIDRDAFDADARKRYCSACENYNGTKCRACWVDDMLGDVADFEAVIQWNKEETE